MENKDQFPANPVGLLGCSGEDTLGKGRLGAVLARAGVGKTPFVVQLAIHAMLRQRGVLHISLEHPVEKIDLWYRELLHRLSQANPQSLPVDTWEAALAYRFILTLKLDGFSVPRIQERIQDLTAQNILMPSMMVVDRYPFGDDSRATLMELKQLAETMNFCVWFTVRTHRHEPPEANGLPVQLHGVDDLFDAIVQLEPSDKDIKILTVKGAVPDADSHPRLCMDTSTQLIRDCA